MKTKILMVCMGNICRSPLAEGILQYKLDNNKFFVNSAGTGGWHQGESPDKRSIKIAEKHGIKIAHQRARKFSETDFEIFDLVYVMDNQNYKEIISLAKTPEHQQKVKLIMNELFEGENMDVPDPYYGLDNGFESVFQMLDEACEVIASKLQS